MIKSKHSVRSKESILNDPRSAKLSRFALNTPTDLPNLPSDLQSAGQWVLVLLLHPQSLYSTSVEDTLSSPLLQHSALSNVQHQDAYNKLSLQTSVIGKFCFSLKLLLSNGIN